MNLPESRRIVASFAAVLVSFALAGCGEVDTTDTGTEELTEQEPSTETPPSAPEWEPAPTVEVGTTPDVGLGKSRPDSAENAPPPRRTLPQ